MTQADKKDTRQKDAEVTPMRVDPSLTFDSIGGLQTYVQALKEMVYLPLMYPEVFDRFKVTPPR
jgi:ATP-dependent 26S proteasome regulatory subunit